MAIENKYINPDIWDDTNNVFLNNKTNPAFNAGAPVQAFVQTFEVAIADDNGSIYRVIKGINPDMIPFSLEIFNDAITGGTDYDVGFYESINNGLGGDAIVANALADAVTMASARTRATGPLDALANVPIQTVKLPIYVLCGQTLETKTNSYDLAITANTAGTAAGTITVRGLFMQG